MTSLGGSAPPSLAITAPSAATLELAPPIVQFPPLSQVHPFASHAHAPVHGIELEGVVVSEPPQATTTQTARREPATRDVNVRMGGA